MPENTWTPVVGVVLPTRDRPAFLGDAIRSVFAQDYTRWQLCVVNDGGADISHVLAEFSDPRIVKVDLNESYGVSEARNLALRILRADIVTFLDDDDKFTPRYFSSIVSGLEKSDVCICRSTYVQERIEGGKRLEISRSNPYSGMKYDYDTLLGGNYIPLPCVSFRTDSGRLFFDPELRVYEDWDFLLRLCGSRVVAQVDIPLLEIYQRVDRVDSATSGAGFVEWMRAFDRVCQKFPTERPDILLRRTLTRQEIIQTRYEPSREAVQISSKPLDNEPAREETSAMRLPWLGDQRWLTAEQSWALEWCSHTSVSMALLVTDGGSDRIEKTRWSLQQQWCPENSSTVHCVGDREVLPALNAAAFAQDADWLAFIDAGDTLAPDAIFRIRQAITRHPAWQLIYTDEDSVSADGQHGNPHCKPDFNIDYLRSLPYVGSLLVIRRELFMDLGGFDPAAEGAEDYDLVLRAWERIGDAGVGHIPEVLYHRLQGGGHCRMSVDEILAASKAVLERHLQRMGIGAEVLPGPFPPATRVRYALSSTPAVSIVIPTRNQLGMLQRCVESIIEKTRYPNYEILIVDNDSDEPEAVKYLELLSASESNFGGRLRVLRHPGPFNFSAMNNRAVALARGEYILLLNNDTAALHEDWLDEMVSQALRPEVGIVGAKLLFPDGRIQHAGVILGMRGAAEHPFIGQAAEYRGYFGRAMLTQNLSAVTGACLLIAKALYEAVGGLDEKDFQVSYNDVDLCLRVRERGKKIVFTPWAILLHEGSASQRGEVERKPSVDKEKRFAGEKMTFYRRWLPQLAFDPAYNRHLSLASTDYLLEDQAALTWDPGWRPRPRILVHPADREGCGEYRIIAPMRALQRAGRVQGWETMRIFEPAEMERFAPESVVVQRQMEWPQIEALERHKALSKAFRVFEIDDLITNLPVKSVHRAHIHKDIAKRFRKAAGLCNRLVVATQPLAEAYRGFSDEIRVQPNCIEDAVWGGLLPRRRNSAKPRVGWAGGVGHTGDLELVADVVRELSSEVDWVFLGLCPDALKPYVREFHSGVPLPRYPAKLASLDLDLAIAPLENNPFNEAKSHLRLLEYGILGYPVVCSDIFPYRGDFPVWRVANRHRDWVRTIRELLADRSALAAAGDALRAHVRAHWLLESHLDDWMAAWLP